MQHFIFCTFFALFACFSEKTQAQSDVTYVSGIALLTSSTSFDQTLFQKNLAAAGLENFSEKGKTFTMEIRQAKVTLTLQETPVSKAEWEPAAGISWIWKNADTEVPKHQAQLVITVSGKDHLPLDLYKTFTKVAGSVLKSSDAIGIYMNNQYLLLPKDYYLTSAAGLSDNELPVTLWVYFGMWQENEKNSGYTWGLQGFGKNELEIVNSNHGIVKVQAFLQETVKDILLKNANLKTGDYVGDERKVMVQVSKGALIEGQTAKLDY